MTDTTTLTGAEFREHVGTDPAKWAEAFVRSTAGEMREAEILERASHVMPWFRDYAEVCVAEAVRHTLDGILEMMVRHKLPITRDNYVDIANAGRPDEAWTHEHEAALPHIFRPDE